jgi:tetratricopeptide (TPR) repeat protein
MTDPGGVTPRRAELLVANYLRSQGFSDARRAHPGPDGGVDVRAQGIVVQVKCHMKPVGSPDVQRLTGVAAYEKALPMFFSLMGFSPQAEQWAGRTGMALFQFDHAEKVSPYNRRARELVDSWNRAKEQAVAPHTDLAKESELQAAFNKAVNNGNWVTLANFFKAMQPAAKIIYMEGLRGTGDPRGIALLGQVAKTDNDVRAWLEKAAAGGDAAALYQQSRLIWITGNSPLDKSRELLRRAAAQGNTPAMCTLSRSLIGTDVAGESVRLSETLALADIPRGIERMLRLARHHKDPEQLKRWAIPYSKYGPALAAIAAGDAEFILGNVEAAKSLYLDAAATGDDPEGEALIALGDLARSEHDVDGARHWYTLGAALNWDCCERLLAVLAEDPKSVPEEILLWEAIYEVGLGDEGSIVASSQLAKILEVRGEYLTATTLYEYMASCGDKPSIARLEEPRPRQPGQEWHPMGCPARAGCSESCTFRISGQDAQRLLSSAPR